jgi:uncharacterized MAPEG superfamily protein
MNFGNFGSVELEMLWLSTALGLVQIVLVVIFGGLSGRVGWAIGPRDAAGPAYGTVGGRLERALNNFLETFAFFAAAVLLAHALGKHTMLSERGAQLYFVARVVYVPVYALGIPGLRTLVWLGSFAGIIMVLQAVYPG